MPFHTLTFELFTPSDDARPVFLAGNFNSWKTRDERFRMEKLADGHYRFEFSSSHPKGQPLEYKYVKGGWESEELTADGRPTVNRRMDISKAKISDTVPRWKSHANWYDPGFYPDVQIVAKKFSLPQLRRRRRISILLPYNYKVSKKRYPVLYLQDGQNLFEEDAPHGTWGVDKQLAALAQHGKGDFIVVGIDHGGNERIQEYLPYKNLKWGDGLGREYASFLAETLKPYIDKNFRTLPDRKNTAIGGSSMGGIISIYAGLMFPKTYSKFMIFSPSLWISPHIFSESERLAGLNDTKIYLYAGGNEGANMVSNSKKFTEMLARRGMNTAFLNIRLEIDPLGHHNEHRWGREFPKAAEWLFG